MPKNPLTIFQLFKDKLKKIHFYSTSAISSLNQSSLKTSTFDSFSILIQEHLLKIKDLSQYELRRNKDPYFVQKEIQQETLFLLKDCTDESDAIKLLGTIIFPGIHKRYFDKNNTEFNIFNYLTPTLHSNPQVISFICRKDISLFASAPDNVRFNQDLITSLFRSINPQKLWENIPESLRTLQMAQTMIQQIQPERIPLISEKFAASLPKEIFSNYNTALKLVQTNGLLLKFISPQIHSQEIVTAAICQNPISIEFISEDFKENANIIHLALIQNANSILKIQTNKPQQWRTPSFIASKILFNLQKQGKKINPFTIKESWLQTNCNAINSFAIPVSLQPLHQNFLNEFSLLAKTIPAATSNSINNKQQTTNNKQQTTNNKQQTTVSNK